MHGTTMMFLFAVPVMLGDGHLLRAADGRRARRSRFPRLLAFGYWMFLFGGIFLYVMFLLNVGPDNGWFSYPPLAGPEYGYGKRADVWAQLITFTEVSALIVAICIITTIFKMRAPGMSLNRMPLFVWAMLVVVVHGRLRDAGGHGREHVPDPRPAGRAPTSSTRPRAATRFSGSTCSGSSAIPRSTSSSCRRSG